MDPTTSVSKGCFLFKNGVKLIKPKKRSWKRKDYLPFLDREMIDQPFYQKYLETWSDIKREIDQIQSESQWRNIKDLVKFVENAHKRSEDHILPAAVLLTGINQPDHHQQFEVISEIIGDKVPVCISTIEARECSSLKNTIESMVYGFLYEQDCDSEEESDRKTLKRSQCSMKVLQNWYNSHFPTQNQTLLVIVPDFESFVPDILQDFILILSSYCSEMPIILILGVATAISALHSTLPYHVMSKIRLQIFHTTPALVGLNEIIENVILSPKNHFFLSGKTFKFLTDIFLFYDFSINGFIQGFKYCLMEHFFRGNAFSLCTNYEDSLEVIKMLSHRDIESIRQLLSFRPYVESMTKRQYIFDILTEDEYLKKKLPKLLRNCHIYFTMFRCLLEFLFVLVDELPKSPLGKQCRELYSFCASSNILNLPEFKECWQMLSFLSKEEFVSKISRSVNHTVDFMERAMNDDDLSKYCKNIIYKKLEELKQYLEKVITSGTKGHSMTSTQPDLKNLSRQELKEKLLEMSRQEKRITGFTKYVQDTLDYIKTEIIAKYLMPFHQGAPPLYELFVFSDISTIRKHIVGSPRAALHTALNNPHFYLQCNCCELENLESLAQTLPDISIIYKLHLECGKMINLYDWLQAFKSIVDFSEDDNEQINPVIQARFTRAVAELQFLGYIKTSKRKTDHVARLTW